MQLRLHAQREQPQQPRQPTRLVHVARAHRLRVLGVLARVSHLETLLQGRLGGLDPGVTQLQDDLVELGGLQGAEVGQAARQLEQREVVLHQHGVAHPERLEVHAELAREQLRRRAEGELLHLRKHAGKIVRRRLDHANLGRDGRRRRRRQAERRHLEAEGARVQEVAEGRDAHRLRVVVLQLGEARLDRGALPVRLVHARHAGAQLGALALRRDELDPLGEGAGHRGHLVPRVKVAARRLLHMCAQLLRGGDARVELGLVLVLRGGKWAVGGGRWAVGSGRWEVGGGR